MTQKEKLISTNDGKFAELIDMILDDDFAKLCNLLEIPENSSNAEIEKHLELYLNQEVDC